MASRIEQGESIFIPFWHGCSISDSQLKPRMYKTPEAFQKCYPGYYKGTEDVELVEYAPEVRCKDCRFYDESGDYCNMWGECRHPDHYCEEGVREDNGQA